MFCVFFVWNIISYYWQRRTIRTKIFWLQKECRWCFFNLYMLVCIPKRFFLFIESVRKKKINLKSHLFTALRSRFQNMNYPLCAKLLKHLIDNGLCGREIVLQTITLLFGKDRSNFNSDIYIKALDHLSKSEPIKYEIRLLKLIHHLSSHLTLSAERWPVAVSQERPNLKLSNF